MELWLIFISILVSGIIIASVLEGIRIEIKNRNNFYINKKKSCTSHVAKNICGNSCHDKETPKSDYGKCLECGEPY